jgi:hypothetical protein
MRCLSRRCTRLRTTAFPTALLTTKPARAGEETSPAACGSEELSPLRARRWTTRRGRPARRPRRTAAAKSSRRLSRFSEGSTSWTGGQSAQADSRVRPLLRRFATIARPARVRMRSRKPWVFARRRLFGWKVRLLTRGLQRCFESRGLRETWMWGADRLSPCAHEQLATPECAPLHYLRDSRKSCPSEAGGSSRRQLDLVTVRAATPSGQTAENPARSPVTPPLACTRPYPGRTRAQPVDNDLNGARRPDYRGRTSHPSRPSGEPHIRGIRSAFHP